MIVYIGIIWGEWKRKWKLITIMVWDLGFRVQGSGSLPGGACQRSRLVCLGNVGKLEPKVALYVGI